MTVELRQKSQITIPKEIIDALGLKEGDALEVSLKDGIIQITPVTVYPKDYIEALRVESEDIKNRMANNEQSIF